MRIKYLAHYALPNNSEKRGYTLSAINKIDYICEALNKKKISVDIISASRTNDTKHFYKGRVLRLGEKNTLKTFFSIPTGNLIRRLLRTVSMNTTLFFELIRLKKDEKIIAYHSLGFMNVLDIAHRIRKFHLILEVEEVYADVIGNLKLRNKEIKFLQSADSYIFPTRLLDEIININNKPAVLVHGTYRVEENRKCKMMKKESDNDESKIIHCVYAGTLDPRKGGAVAAAAAAEFLPSNYHVHIIGFGTENEISRMKEYVLDVSKKSKAKVTYDGLLSGDEYICFLQSCDIGLSTQNPNAPFNDTSFPSKVLSYMANGLRVISIRIPAIETSAIGEHMYYYEQQTAEKIANAILNVNINDNYNAESVIMNLDNSFQKDIYNLVLENMKNEM